MGPKAIGPYSLVRRGECKSLFFISGQLGINPDSGELEEGLEAQTKRALENLKSILESSGLSMNNVIKTTIFLINSEDFSKVNEIYSTFFTEPYPARSTIFVKALPKNALIEIEAIACL
ncbi:MAG: Rid family detoxifying hydrolase [bacterium]|nr:Rid family detoxifying hydrolase [bacterium]